MQAILNFCEQTGFYQFFQGDNRKCAIMIVVACVLLFLGIVKKFEPLLLVPIAVGMLVTNLPGAEMYHEILFAGGHIHWDLFGGNPITAEFIAEMQASGVSEAVLSSVAVGQTVSVGLIDVLYLGIKLGIYPCLIFMGVGAMTDFGPLIANPKSLLLGAAAQLGIFLTYVGCRLLGSPARRPPLWASSAARTAPPPSSSPPCWPRPCWAPSPCRPIPTWRWCL